MLNLKALKAVEQRMAERQGGGGSFLTTKEMGEETDVRILPPLPQLNGVYFKETVVFWINKKKYTSWETYGKPCVIQEELDAAKAKAKASGDKDLQALCDSNSFQKKTAYYVPLIHLDCEFGEKGETLSVKIVPDSKGKVAAKVLECGPQIIQAVNKIATNARNANGTDDGIFDLKRGLNICLTKTGAGVDTKYGAQAWRDEFDLTADPKFKELIKAENIPDVEGMVKKSMKSDAYLRSVVKNYFYGTPIIADDNSEAPAEDAPKQGRRPVDESNSGGVDESKTTAKEEPTAKTTGSRRLAPAEDDQKTEDKPERNIADDLANYKG